MCFIPEMAFFGGSIGASEWVMMFVVVLVVVGPRKLPELARKFGRTMEMFRRAADEFKEQLMNMDQDVKTTVNEAAGNVDFESGEDEEDPDGSYSESYDYDEGAYEDEDDYPGNEEFSSEWESEEDADDDAQGELSSDMPDRMNSSGENVCSSDKEDSDSDVRDKKGSTEEKA
ncbi:MAG: twin-arginine translocase TatA/TatE family subunit [Kiritimatiellia bacterium]